MALHAHAHCIQYTILSGLRWPHTVRTGRHISPERCLQVCTTILPGTSQAESAYLKDVLRRFTLPTTAQV